MFVDFATNPKTAKLLAKNINKSSGPGQGRGGAVSCVVLIFQLLGKLRLSGKNGKARLPENYDSRKQIGKVRLPRGGGGSFPKLRSDDRPPDYQWLYLAKNEKLP